jgi:tripartite ATP-independent transporter DctP family solute receptor
MKKQLILAVLFLLSMVLVACGDSDANETTGDQTEEKTYDLKFGHAANENHPMHLGFTKFVELVGEKSDGRIKITVYPNRQLGDDLEIQQNIINGSVDLGGVSTSVTSAYTPLLESLQLPFLLNNYEIEEEAVKTEEFKNILAALETELGATGIGIYEGGMRHIANNEKVVKTPEDLKGLKLRVAQSDLIIDIFNTLGASPTPMAYGEVYSALQTGVIDGEEVNLSTIYAEKHLEVLENLTISGQFPYPAVVLINNDIYNSFSEEDKALIQEANAEAEAYLFDQIKELDATALKAIKDKGIKVHEIENPEAFMEVLDPLYEKYEAKDPLIKAFVEKVNTLK